MTPADDLSSGRLVIGSRRSSLARIQSQWVGRRLEQAWPGLTVEFVTLTTAGDRDRRTPLPEIGGKGLFTEDLDRALAAGDIDLAVHSLKDLPTDAPGDENLVAIPERDDPRDVLVLSCRLSVTDLSDLPSGLTIGTSSVRRAAQITRAVEGVSVGPVRGNVETRLRRVADGDLDGVILAAAGLSRLGLAPEGAVPLDPPDWLPAPGQGALAVQGRIDDQRVRRLGRAIHHLATAAAVTAERSFLAALEGGCHVPIAGLGRVEDESLTLLGAIYPDDPSADVVRGSVTGRVEEAADLGERLASALSR